MKWYEWIAPILGFLGIIGFIVFVIVVGIYNDKYEKEQKAKQAGKPKEDFPEPVELCVHAKVSKMECATRYVGIKQPKLIKDFLVFFEDDEGTEYRLLVDEADYCALEEGMTGMLTLIDGQLNGFELDE